MAGVQTRKALSPFSASSIQQKPLFTSQGPSKVAEFPKLQAILEASTGTEPLISARRPVSTAPLVVESRTSVPSAVRQMTLFLQLPAQRPAADESEQEEEEFGEVSTATMSSKLSSFHLSEAESIAPKASSPMPEMPQAYSGFWAEVGAETMGRKCTGFQEESDSDWSTWETGSDDLEEEETLLPWDM